MSKLKWKSIGLKEGERLTAGGAHHRAPAWSADGSLLAFTVGEAWESALVVCDRRGRVQRVVPGPAADGASFGPDGALAFVRPLGRSSEIWLQPAQAVPPVRLVGGDGLYHAHPAFSPDGSTLAFVSAESVEAPARLMVLELATGKRHALSPDGGLRHAHPAFSVDGAELWFEASGDGEPGVFALRLSDHALDRLTPPQVRAGHPAPLSRDLVVVEEIEAGAPRLALYDRAERRARALALDEAMRAPAEPAAYVSRSGKVRLAWSAAPSDGDRMLEIMTARLRGLTVGANAAEPESEPEPEPESESEEPKPPEERRA